ncbi:MAG: ABC transporter permease subunit [Actinobacteria bacterium]|nr:MAG: ABC transporter permease subunit [Actinomycetota bacterium]
MPGRRRFPLAWLGVIPFFVYATAFLLLPSGVVLVGAFKSDKGSFTLKNMSQVIHTPEYIHAFRTSIELSLVTAVGGGIFGLLLAYAAARSGTPRFIRPILTTFSGVAANFAGVPLAFAFIATIGNLGIVTKFLKDQLGVGIYQHGFSLFSFTGLAIVYLYFQIPLMILVIAPAVDGLRAEWREASSNLGASSYQYWRHIGFPVLLPSVLGATILLFGNSFAAYATASQLTGSAVNIVPIIIGQNIGGDVLSNPRLSEALAFGMIVVIAVSMLLYALVQRRASRWMK